MKQTRNCEIYVTWYTHTTCCVVYVYSLGYFEVYHTVYIYIKVYTLLQHRFCLGLHNLRARVENHPGVVIAA